MDKTQPKKYVIVGTGARARMYIDAIIQTYPQHAGLVGLCDISQTRMDYWNTYIAQELGHARVATYVAADFDRMIAEGRPDIVIVLTVDASHHIYINRAMELGCDVVTEKPMTIDERKVASIFETIERTDRKLRVAFNYRYMSVFTKLREVVMSGAIGTPTLVDFQWRLDTSHGADYFRRWHRERDQSGGLLVHKSTHHFDLVNFVLGDYPESVFCHGGLMFYGEKNAASRGESYGYERYTGEPDAGADPFALTLDQEGYKGLYLDAEADSGYIRDRNVFAGEDKWPITTCDTVTLSARYRKGALLSYSLIAYCPWEGERMSVTGTRGQVEYFGRGSGHIIRGQGDAELAAEQYQGEQFIRLQRMFEPPVMLEIPDAAGGHGGGDRAIVERIFGPDDAQDPLGRDATHVDGAASVLMGVAANRSIDTGRAVTIDSLMALPTA